MTRVSASIAASHTWREIHAQPEIWRDWELRLDVAGIRDWVAGLNVEDVWFCGAGTSAYIGDIIVAGLEGQPGPRLRSVPTTDLVARPAAYLGRGRKVLIVNFGRSGQSSETIGTLEAVAALAPDTAMLNITCNGESALAKAPGGRAIVLPEACHDAGFAMTSSFSTMLLTALSLFDAKAPEPGMMARLADAAEATLAQALERVSTGERPARAVYVGSGAMAYAARESALKVMELAAGQIPCLWDSTLGFRHGPKSFVAAETALHVLLSNDAHARRYDDDLAAELMLQFPQSSVTTVGSGGDIETGFDGPDSWGAVLAVLLAQVQSVLWSDALALNIDDPFAGHGTLSRVVSGVTLYPVEQAQ